MASEELGNGPHVLASVPMVLSVLVTTPNAPLLMRVSGWAEDIMCMAILVPMAFVLHVTRMGTDVAALGVVLPAVEIRKSLEWDRPVATRSDDESLLEHAHRPLLLHMLDGVRASVVRLMAPGLVFVLILTAEDENAGGGILWFTIATRRATIVEPTTPAPLDFRPLLIVAKATEVGFVQLPVVANPRAPLPMQKLEPEVPAVSTELVSLTHGLPLVLM